MKHLTLLIAFAALLLTAGCTKGDDIGPWFGTWHIERMTNDGTYVDLDPEAIGANYYIQFQHSVVCVRYNNDMHDIGSAYGSWSESDGRLTIVFDPEQASTLLPLDATYTVNRQSSTQITLTTTDADGHTIELELTKL